MLVVGVLLTILGIVLSLSPMRVTLELGSAISLFSTVMLFAGSSFVVSAFVVSHLEDK